MKEFIGLCCPVLNSLLLKLSMMNTMMRKVVGLAETKDIKGDTNYAENIDKKVVKILQKRDI